MTQRAEHVQLFADGALSKPCSTLAAHLKYDVQPGALGTADGDGAAEQKPLAALDIDELSHLCGLRQLSGLQPDGYGVGV